MPDATAKRVLRMLFEPGPRKLEDYHKPCGVYREAAARPYAGVSRYVEARRCRAYSEFVVEYKAGQQHRKALQFRICGFDGGGLAEQEHSMWPRSSRGEEKVTERKRLYEMQVILSILKCFVGDRRSSLDVFEFGAGAGYQSAALRTLGRTVASDVYVHPRGQFPPGVPFVVCNVEQLPFHDRSFDLIFSNQVMEYVTDYAKCFHELSRVGRSDCLYAFAVPTPVWLVLSLPTIYWQKLESLLVRAKGKTEAADLCRDNSRPDSLIAIEKVRWKRLLSKFLPHAHGRYRRYLEAMRQWRASVWRTIFREYGFEIVWEEGVLCYAPSRWPIIPTNRILARAGIASSRLFILRKRPIP